jgi:hypothetical protein
VKRLLHAGVAVLVGVLTIAGASSAARTRCGGAWLMETGQAEGSVAVLVLTHITACLTPKRTVMLDETRLVSVFDQTTTFQVYAPSGPHVVTVEDYCPNVGWASCASINVEVP